MWAGEKKWIVALGALALILAFVIEVDVREEARAEITGSLFVWCSSLGLAWLGRQAYFYSPAERAAVAGLLAWLSTEWPLAPCVALARKHFWQGAGN